MIALVVTFLVAVYFFGPELLSRWILGFVVPRKSVVQTRGEEVTRALVWAALPLVIAVAWTYGWWSSHGYGSAQEVITVFSGLNSDIIFQAQGRKFFDAAYTVFWMNLSVLWRLYLIVALFSGILNAVVLNYRYLRQRWWGRLVTMVVARLTLPQISEWHLLLSGMLLPSESLDLHADILTKDGNLYQGKVQEKLLGPEGRLETITLSRPRRFMRQQYLEKKQQWSSTRSEDYWRPIPGNLFVIFASQIVNVNLRYIDRNLDVSTVSQAEREVFMRLLQKLTEPPRE